MIAMPWLLALFVLVGGAQQTENPSAIVAWHWAQYSDSIVRRDTDAIANLYGADARLMEPGLDDIVGRIAIHSLLAYAFSQRVRTVDVKMIPRDVVGYEGVIYDQGDYIETMAPQDNPRRAYDIYGRYFAVWAQQPDGSWKIARMMRSTKKPPTR